MLITQPWSQVQNVTRPKHCLWTTPLLPTVFQLLVGKQKPKYTQIIQHFHNNNSNNKSKEDKQELRDHTQEDGSSKKRRTDALLSVDS